MKKSEWSDEQLENALKQMPMINDNRSPQEIYQNISHRVEKKNNYRKKWIVPSIATVAAAFILFIMLPTFFNDINFTGQDSASMESTHNDDAMIMMESNLEESQEAPTEKMEIMEEESKMTTDSMDEIGLGELTNVIWEQDLGGKTLLTYNVPHESVAFFVPLTILVEPDGQNPIKLMNDYMSIVNTEITQSKWGLEPFPTQYYDFQEITKENGLKSVRADIKEGLYTESFSTAESYSFTEGLQSFRWFDETNYKEVEIFQNNQQNVMIGQTGVVQPSIELNQKFAYYYYESSNNETQTGFLVPTPYQYIGYPDDFESALELMKDEVELGDIITLEPTIAEDITIEDIIDQGENVEIVFTSNSALMDNEQGRLMIEAIMLTAKEFGYHTVTFTGSIEKIGEVPFGEAVAVPLAPNPITYQ